MRSVVPWEELTVLATAGDTPGKIGWTPSSKLFPAETCARHVYVGREADFTDAPQELLRNGVTKLYKGLDAYVFLMKFYCGLETHHRLEPHVTAQFRKAWETYCRRYPAERKNLLPYVEVFYHDGTLVNNRILVHCARHPTIENAAIDLAELSPDKKALVICGAEELSVSTITALAQKRKRNPKSIVVTHPDAGALAAIERAVRALPKNRNISAQLQFVPFAKALDPNSSSPVSTADAVLVCTPMTGGPNTLPAHTALNDRICTAWMERRESYPGRGGKIIHLKGNPYERGTTTGSWLALDPKQDGFVPYTMLVGEQGRRRRHLDEVTDRTRELFKVMGNHRVAGKNIVDVKLNPVTTQVECTAGRGPGRPVRPSVDATALATIPAASQLAH